MAKYGWMMSGMVALAAAALAAGPGRAAVHLDFDSDQRGTSPAWLRFDASPGMATGRWIVVPDRKPMSSPNIAVQGYGAGDAGSYRFAISMDAKKFTDGIVRAAVSARSLKGMKSAGVVLRYEGPGDFLGAEYDFNAAEVEIFEARGGKRETLARAKAVSEEQGWTTVGLSADGESLVASISGRKVLEARDPHPASGEAGLFTEGSTVAAFDDLDIEPR